MVPSSDFKLSTGDSQSESRPVRAHLQTVLNRYLGASESYNCLTGPGPSGRQANEQSLLHG